MDKIEKIGRRSGLGFIIINIAILAGAALFLIAADAAYRNRIKTETLRDSKFLTTEWHLMKELKERTDQELRDKDQEIAELRRRYVSLKDSGSPIELLAAIEDEMKRAEAEREAILSARLKAVASPPAALSPASPASIADAPSPRGPTLGVERLGSPDTALSELLRSRIAGLEESLRMSLAGEAAIERELAGLRRSMAQGYAGMAAPVPADAPAAASELRDYGEADGLVESILAALAQERDSLADTDAVLGISDLKTRALLRAIVRTPAIRAEYPDLLESFDRYLAIAGKEEYLRGKREAYADLIETIGALKGGQGK